MRNERQVSEVDTRSFKCNVYAQEVVAAHM